MPAPGAVAPSGTPGTDDDRESITLVNKEGEPFPENPAVSAGFGHMLGMTLVSGRWLPELDEPGALPDWCLESDDRPEPR
jgi:hypothetical protein